MPLKSDQIDQVVAALDQVQRTLPTVNRDKTAKIITKNGGSFSYSYADLGTVFDAVRPLLEANELFITQVPDTVGVGAAALTTLLVHVPSGQYIGATSPVVLADNTGQSQGSGITYLRRYALCSVLGLVTEDDDDGAAATHKSEPKVAEARVRPAPFTGPLVQPTATAKDDNVTNMFGDPIPPDDGRPFDETQAQAAVEKEFGHVEVIDSKGNSDYPDERGRKHKDGPTGPQVKRLFAIAKANNLDVGDLVKDQTIDHSTDPAMLHWKQYNDICKGLS